MTDISRYLSADHTHCDNLFAAAENAVASADWQRGQTLFQALEAATLRHFTREESVLFPAFEARTGMRHGPTTVMRGEHVEMRETLQAMGQAIARRDADAYLGLAETLLMLMRQHNLKEEQILYPMADQALADTASEMVRQMETLFSVKSHVLVDARWLEPPEPMERALAALDDLHPGQGIRFLIHREPLPLYGVLHHMGYRHKTHLLEDGCYEVQIEPCE